MKIIGLMGPAASGKSTIGTYLVQKYGAKRYSFAYPLKEIVRRAFDLTEDQVFGTQKDKETVDARYNVTPRWLLQRIGTEGIREVLGRDIWWQNCLSRIFNDQPEVAVIEDFRFLNEVNGFLALNTQEGGPQSYIWRLEHPADRVTEADQTHQSEAEWSTCPFTNLVKPEKYGLIELYDAVDKAAFDSCLVAAQKVLK